jgi:formate dehydrogenase maturation protein FdhE
MKKEKFTFLNFINFYQELIGSYAKNFSDNSFNMKIVQKNVQLIKEYKYALTDEIWNIDEEQNHKFITGFIKLLKSYAKEYIKDIKYIENILLNNIPFSRQFTIDILQNKHKIVFDFAKDNGLGNDFISFFSIFLAYPYREAAASFVKSKIELKNHVSGFCPICGHWPGISYLTEKEGKKIMACIHCDTYWLFPRLKCSFCSTTDKNALGYLNIEGKKKVSAYVCEICRKYLKTVRIKDESYLYTEKLHAIVDYLSSGDIDIAAIQNNYIQEPILSTINHDSNNSHIKLYLNKLQNKIVTN